LRARRDGGFAALELRLLLGPHTRIELGVAVVRSSSASRYRPTRADTAARTNAVPPVASARQQRRARSRAAARESRSRRTQRSCRPRGRRRSTGWQVLSEAGGPLRFMRSMICMTATIGAANSRRS
jgi:hypothetical protein